MNFVGESEDDFWTLGLSAIVYFSDISSLFSIFQTLSSFVLQRSHGRKQAQGAMQTSLK